MHFKRLLSLIMAVSMLLSLSPLAYAEYSTPVTVTSEAAIFNVSVPTVLPVSVSDHGLITTASDTAITNHSWGPIYIAGLSVTGNDGWVTTDYDTTVMSAQKVDTHTVAMTINGSKTTGPDTVDFVATGFGNINGAGGTCAINYDAKLPAQSTAISNADIMNVMFTIAWNEVSTAAISAEPTTAALVPGDTKAATLSFNNTDPSATTVTVASSDEKVATASVETPVTTTSTNDSTNDASLSAFSLVDTAYASDFTGLPVSKAVGIKIKAVGPGTCTITGTLADGTKAQMEVTVDEKLMTSIKVANAPTKTDYIEGNSFDPTGMVVHAVYNNGSEETISNYEMGTTKLSLGQSGVNLSYNGKTCTVPLSIRAKQLLSLAVSKTPTKTSYVEGQNFDPTGMVVTGSYDNGDVLPIEGYTADPKLSLGQSSVMVSFGGKSCSTPISVVEKVMESLAVVTAPTKTSYIEGNAFDKTGMAVEATYNDGSKVPVTNYTVDSKVTLGQTTVTVAFGGKTCTQNITVVGKSLASIAITKAPTKTSYIDSQSFDPSGMVVTASYDNGDTAAISNYAVDNTLTAGQTNVKVSYGGKTCTQDISVIAKAVENLVITTAPAKTSYIEDTAFDKAGMVVTATYNDGDVQAVTDYTMDSKVTLGQTAITIAFGGKTCTQNITVVGKSPVGVSVKTPATKTRYIIGDTFDSTGLVLNLDYDNGTSSELSSGFTVSADVSTTATTSATITYGNLSCTMPIVVSRPDWDTNPMTSTQVTAAKLVFDSATGTIKKGSTALTGNLNLPSSVDNVRVTNIDRYVFSNYRDLTSVTIPGSIASIGDGAFSGCSGLKSITISNGVTSIGISAFASCSSLTSVIIPNSVTTIGYNAFYYCSGLASITIPSSITNIGDKVFQCCKGLTSAIISNGAPRIGNGTFYECSALSSVTIPSSITSIDKDSFVNCSGLTSITIPSSVTSIGESAFSGCSGLTSITIPSSVISIGENAFCGCSGLTSVTIPSSVTSIGDSAFDSCSGLTSVTIPNGITSIDSSVFYGCSGLANITSNSSAFRVENNRFLIRNTDSTLITFASSGTTSVTIPSSVISIGNGAFYGSAITSATIPNSVTSIGSCAFYNCASLTSVTIPNSVTSIGDSAFEGCFHLTSVTIPSSITSIGNSVFSRSGLTTVTMPNSITSIGASAFRWCSSLTAITIPSSATSIGASAFAGSGLTSITIPNSVTNIGSCAFFNCSSLSTVKILSTNLITVDYAAFNSLKTYSTIYVKNSAIKALFTSNNYTAANTTISINANLS